MARANILSGGEPKASFTNTASARGTKASATVKIGITNDFMPIDKTSETYLEMMDATKLRLQDATIGGQTVRDTPDGISAEDIKQYVMRYRVVLNKGKERLNDGNDIVAEDEYSANLSVDFTSIRITTDPADAVSRVSYDYTGNIGYFTIPDETQVIIEYDAIVLQTTAAVVGVSNEVRMLQYKKSLDDFVDHSGGGGSSAINPSILVKKYGSGHMEKGLNGAKFQLYKYKHDTYARNDPNTENDWEPVILREGTPDAHFAMFTTGNLDGYGDGYAEIELSQDNDGMTLALGKVYGLREIETPVGYATNGDIINYQNPQSVIGIPFTVTSQEIKDAEDKSVTINNTYTRETVNLTVNKRWASPSGASITWPSGKSVQITLGRLDDDDQFVAVPGVSPVTLDNKRDSVGEETAGSAVFRNLPKYEVTQNGALIPIRYAARETQSVAGYDVVYPDAALDYGAFGNLTYVTIRNQAESTGIHVSKVWDRQIVPNGATATFRLYAYTGNDPSTAAWVNNVNDITLDGVADEGTETFGEKVAWQASFTGLPLYNSNSELLHYIAKEHSATPAGYEPVEEYAADGGSITNRPASTTFSVRKNWSGTPNDAWPSGEQIALTLKRKTSAGVNDDAFAANYVLAANGIISQDSITDPYGDARQAGVWSGGTLTITDLPKYDENGREWRYYVTETAIQTAEGADITGNYRIVYRDRYNYVSTFVYSGGSVTNIRSTKELSLSKAVAGSMGDKTKPFQFTVELRAGDVGYNGDIEFSKVDQDGDTTSGTMAFTDGAAIVTLKHDESITFLNLSGTLNYRITESANDTAGYQTEYRINASASEMGRIASGGLDSNPHVAYINTRNAVVPTGVWGSDCIYLLGLAFFGICMQLLKTRKRDDTPETDL